MPPGGIRSPAPQSERGLFSRRTQIKQDVGASRDKYGDHYDNQDHHPTSRCSLRGLLHDSYYCEYYCEVAAADVPLVFVSVTVTATTSAELAETVNGTVNMNWLPNAFEAEF